MRASSRAETSVWSPPRAELAELGPYLVYEELASGGLATVHRAVDCRTGDFETSIALKRLRPELASDWQLVDAFMHEAQLASQLRHPRIAEAYEYGRIHGAYYIAMELVPGPTLEQIMTQSRSAAGAIPLPIVVEILVQLCDALDYLHTRSVRIIHRDVSPANVIVSSTGSVKLTDFGMAKTTARAPTNPGVIKGTLGYVAPEYTLGQLDTRADLFAIGVIAHELLTGRRLFGGGKDGYATIWRVREKPIQPPSRWNPHVSRDLDDIVITALQRDPELRWQNAAALRYALAAVARQLDPVNKRLIRDWTQWAFTRKPRRDSTKICRMIDSLELDFRQSP